MPTIKAPVTVLVIAAALLLGSQQNAQAQREVDVYGGLWIPFLPDYNAGSIVPNGGGSVQTPNIFNDNQTDVGGQIGIRGLYRFYPTKTMVEFDLNIAGIDSMGSNASVADPDAASTVWLANLTGTGFLATANGATAHFSLDSDVLHYSEFIGLRDRFDISRWGMGTVDLGCGFSHLGFQQDFTLSALFDGSGNTGRYFEQIDTNYIGGDIRSTFNKQIHGRMVRLDLNFGIYDMDGKYDGRSVFRNAGGAVLNTSSVVDEIKKTAFTLDVGLRMDTNIRGVLVRPGIHFKYFTDMVSMNHPQTIVAADPVRLTTKDAYVLGLNVEVML